MRYLAGSLGAACSNATAKKSLRASYDFDGFFKKSVGVTSCGELRAPAAVLRERVRRKNVQLLAG